MIHQPTMTQCLFAFESSYLGVLFVGLLEELLLLTLYAQGDVRADQDVPPVAPPGVLLTLLMYKGNKLTCAEDVTRIMFPTHIFLKASKLVYCNV